MDLPSFSLLLPNLLIGLCKGSRLLEPHATEFRRELGYQPFQLEPSVKLIEGGRVQPELVLVSSKVRHTIAWEWTELETVGAKKADQLGRYSRLSLADVIDVLAVPVDAAGGPDVAVVVRPEAVSEFEGFWEAHSLHFPLLSLSPSSSGGALLQKHANRFGEATTDRFFGIRTFSRIPRRYVPFALDDITPSALAAPTTQHLIALVQKRVEHFDLPAFCEGSIWAWGIIGLQKQRQVSQCTRDILNKLLTKPVGRELLRRTQDNPPGWHILPREGVGPLGVKGLRSRLDSFVRELRGQSFQKEFDFGAPDHAP